MTIKKFQGRTREEATERAKAELGEDAVIMNVKEIVPKGVFRSFKKSIFEVTAAVEEKEKSQEADGTGSDKPEHGKEIDSICKIVKGGM